MDFSVIVLAVVVTALVFDFTNGFHDTVNAMATSTAAGIYALSRRKPITAENVNDVPAAQPAIASA